MKRNILILGLAALVGLASCNKTNSSSKRLSGETWEVTSLKIDGESEEADHLPELIFSECDIYDEVCMAEWEIHGEHAEFAWQFDENGSKFTISNQSEAGHGHDHDHDHGHAHADPIGQCQELSGTYDVDNMDKKTMKISSSATIGHNGERVEIELKRV